MGVEFSYGVHVFRKYWVKCLMLFCTGHPVGFYHPVRGVLIPVRGGADALYGFKTVRPICRPCHQLQGHAQCHTRGSTVLLYLGVGGYSLNAYRHAPHSSSE